MGYGQEMTVMSYNIKYDNVNDTVNNWNNRKQAMVRLIKHYNPQSLWYTGGPLPSNHLFGW